MILDDTWVSVEAVSDDDIPLLVRYRPNLSNFFETGVYLQRMDVTWNYESFDPSLLMRGGFHFARLDIVARFELGQDGIEDVDHLGIAGARFAKTELQRGRAIVEHGNRVHSARAPIPVIDEATQRALARV